MRTGNLINKLPPHQNIKLLRGAIHHRNNRVITWNNEKRTTTRRLRRHLETGQLANRGRKLGGHHRRPNFTIIERRIYPPFFQFDALLAQILVWKCRTSHQLSENVYRLFIGAIGGFFRKIVFMGVPLGFSFAPYVLHRGVCAVHYAGTWDAS